jgi:nitrogen fixation protein NifB
MTSLPPLSPCSAQSGGAAQRCAGHRNPAAAESPFPHLEGRHPCFSLTPEGHSQAARLHLPVSPACNITCRFCHRAFNDTDHRPGVARALVSPDQAVDVVRRALDLCPSLAVVGIAGPGDTLCTDHALRAFSFIHAAFPDLINCLSTNGLRLAEKAEAIVAAGIKTVTVTVNAVDPTIEAAISPSITYRGQRLTGTAAAARLILNQIEGIRRISALGGVVKVNTVLIPGLNDTHVEAVARTVAAAGAAMINLIPLLPAFDFADRPAPSAAQLAKAQAAAGAHLTVFSHCRRCRADACGIPGQSDVSAALYGGTGMNSAATFSHG